jgi:hypothetical protein
MSWTERASSHLRTVWACGEVIVVISVVVIAGVRLLWLNVQRKALLYIWTYGHHTRRVLAIVRKSLATDPVRYPSV